MTTKRTNKPAHIWVGIIPGIFGYGISVAAKTKAGAMTALREAYADWKIARPDSSTNFETSFENWGGYVQRINLGESYQDGFRYNG
jgi:hypothetical protein